MLMVHLLGLYMARVDDSDTDQLLWKKGNHGRCLHEMIKQ